MLDATAMTGLTLGAALLASALASVLLIETERQRQHTARLRRNLDRYGGLS